MNTPASPEVVLSCEGVWKIFGKRAASVSSTPTDAELAKLGLLVGVRDVSLQVHKGEIFVIMGLSGSGKSTLVRCMSRLVEPTIGTVHHNGRNLLTLSEAELKEVRRHQMGMVFQNFALLPHLTVVQNVAFPLEIQGVARDERMRRAMEMVRLVGLNGRENHYPHELSGGQQQRVGIARSLAAEPDLWFLDEPFSALDPLIRREMQDEFLRLQKALHKTIVFITHDFDEAVRLADRIAIMKDGRLVQCGSPEELLLSPATDYVRDFTCAVARAKVLSVRSVMEEIGTEPARGPRIAASSRIADIAPLMFSPDASATVVDEHGNPIGIVTKDAVFRVFAESRT